MQQKNEDWEGFEDERHLGEPEPNGGSSVSGGAGGQGSMPQAIAVWVQAQTGQLAVRE